jgi:alanine dehydrogenase
VGLPVCVQQVVILGAGIVGEFATKAAIGLGASVKVFDNSLSKLRRLHTLVDSRVPTSIIDPKELTKSLRRADVVIGALPRLNHVTYRNGRYGDENEKRKCHH